MRRLLSSELSTSQIDALRSLSGFGGADAARSLGQLISGPVEMGAARASLYQRDSLESLFAPEPTGVSVRFRAEGGARVRILVQLTREGASRVADALIGAKAGNATLYRSALAEAANILVSSYLSGISAAVGMTLVPSVPELSVGPLEDSGAAAFGDLGEPLLLVTDFRFPGTPLAGRIFMAPEVEALEALLGTLGAL